MSYFGDGESELSFKLPDKRTKETVASAQFLSYGSLLNTNIRIPDTKDIENVIRVLKLERVLVSKIQKLSFDPEQ